METTEQPNTPSTISDATKNSPRPKITDSGLEALKNEVIWSHKNRASTSNSNFWAVAFVETSDSEGVKVGQNIQVTVTPQGDTALLVQFPATENTGFKLNPKPNCAPFKMEINTRDNTCKLLEQYQIENGQ